MERHITASNQPAQALITPNEHEAMIDYEVAYYEMRNVAAFIINVIAGEINDGLIIVDNEEPISSRKKSKMRQVLRISHSLPNRQVPTSFNGHDSTLSILLSSMKAVSCENTASVKHFGDYHDSRL